MAPSSLIPIRAQRAQARARLPKLGQGTGVSLAPLRRRSRSCSQSVCRALSIPSRTLVEVRGLLPMFLGPDAQVSSYRARVNRSNDLHVFVNPSLGVTSP